MNKAMIFFGIAAAVGTGYILAKKYIDKNPEAVAAVKENCSDKLHKASVYCTGAVKTGSEKLTKSVNEIVSAGREKSAELMKKAATTGTAFKNEINNLKDMVVSINSGVDVDISDADEGDSDAGNFAFTEDGEEKEIFETPEEGSEAL
jgi:hypothetical protein